ncbi:MAG: DUF123 domain-containing protein, partial [Nitrososphaeria archaeon]|nr:DUF123 domain-containing protein [Nitrososphaeria archaeon]NIN51659.1 DUF123 domain-containing protein [Nitrososphaeria archaeon]NIQ32143.1 DUF123 domain-containing protein [Nitrososphaeria archaeon]
SKDKRMFWHIDHFTANSQIEIKVAISAFTDEVSECTLTLQLINALNAKLALRGFGSSDCRCEGHLIYVTPVGLGSDIKDLIDRVYATFSELGLQPTFHEKTK